LEWTRRCIRRGEEAIGTDGERKGKDGRERLYGGWKERRHAQDVWGEPKLEATRTAKVVGTSENNYPVLLAHAM